MRIGINLLYLLPGIVGGTQTYAQELLCALAEVDTKHDYLLYVNRESEALPLPDATSARFQRVVCPVNATSRRARYQYEQLDFPRRCRADGIALLHSLGYIGPLFPPCRHVVSIHDLNYIGHRQNMPWQRRLPLQFFVRQVARRCQHVIAVSEFSRRQIVADTRVPLEKVTTIHEAGRPPHPEARASETLSQYGLEAPYILAFTSLSAHKNIARLLEAFALIRQECSHRLALVGHLPPDSDLQSQIQQLGLRERIVVTGYVPDAHIMPLLQNADLFVFPSWYEGFGLPILDAQQAGVPIASSNAASLPEVAGEGALFFDPYSTAEMARTMLRCVQDSTLRTDLCHKGTANLSRFSWQRAAQETLAVYEQVLAG